MSSQRTYDIHKLLYRRQFVLGPRFVEEFKSWKRIRVNDSLCLTVHPDLNTCRADHKDNSIILLGYILDPDNPNADDLEIINSLTVKLYNSDSLDSFFECTYIFGGRWILIVNDGKEIRLFNDAVGYRQIFYTDTLSVKDLWCASQPGTIANILHLDIDREAYEFIKLFEKNDKEYWWPGDSSPYKEIRHLLPNHYISLKTGLSKRYWPQKELENISLTESVKKNKKILQGLMKSASNRFQLALSLTAGKDSRLILASSKELRNNIYYFTLAFWDVTKKSLDIQIPLKLLAKLGLKHNIIKCPSRMDDEFAKIYNGNVATARDAYGTITQGMYDSYPQDYVCVKGNAMPVACRRTYKMSDGNMEDVNEETFARVIKMEKNPFAMRALKKWVSGTKEIYNINIFDLYYWENREANWQAMSQLECDIVHETFVPYNCRSFLMNMLSINEEYRKPPEYIVINKLFGDMWPELLSEPINCQPGRKEKIKSLIKKVIIKTVLPNY